MSVPTIDGEPIRLTDAMVSMAVTAMLRSAVGLSLEDSFAMYERWLADRQADAWNQGYRAAVDDRHQPLYRSPNPYRYPKTEAGNKLDGARTPCHD